MAPAAKGSVEVKSAITLAMAAETRLQIGKPIACNVNEGSYSSTEYASRNENDPYLTGIGQLFDVSDNSACTRIQIT